MISCIIHLLYYWSLLLLMSLFVLFCCLGNIDGVTQNMFTEGISKYVDDHIIEVKTPDFTAFQKVAPKAEVTQDGSSPRLPIQRMSLLLHFHLL